LFRSSHGSSNPQAIQRELVPQARAFRISGRCRLLEAVLRTFAQSLTKVAGHKHSTVHPILPL
jgi:hypothetical protein